MPLQQEEQPRRYTYADYLTWPEGCHIELIDGIPYRYGEVVTDIPESITMQATPTRHHQKVSGALFNQVYNFLKGKPCEAYAAPFTVRLGEEDDNGPTVEPDIVVVCDRSKLDDKGCKGAPDLVVEILSPSTARVDRIIKFNKYQQAGVKEYWIVDPDTMTAQVCVLNNGQYILSAYGDTDTAPVTVLPGCTINLQDVFAEE